MGQPASVGTGTGHTDLGAEHVRAAEPPVDFVAESDARDAAARGERIHIGPKTIITPLAYEFGEEHDIFDRS